ncbi:MAG: SDR family oxidoreductase [Candidatus Hydrogenedentes bacterium]|nr:SDR family oxidoreductase [Candidatus Hydrogenedentota bacterium]
MTEFGGQVIVVTGASEGIGRAFCLALAPQGVKFALAARNEERLQSLKEEVVALGSEALILPTDVTDERACKQLIEQTVAAWGRIDVLVNNAGGTMWTIFEEITDLSLFERLMRLNYLSCVYTTYHALPYLKASKGRIMAMSSVAGLTGVPTRTGYAAAKHAMFGFFDSLRIELAPHGVSVTMVAPGFVLSEIHRRALGSDGRAIGKSPMKADKIMTAEACAALMVEALSRRQRLLLPSARGRLARWLKLIAPARMDALAAKAIREKK